MKTQPNKASRSETIRGILCIIIMIACMIGIRANIRVLKDPFSATSFTVYNLSDEQECRLVNCLKARWFDAWLNLMMVGSTCGSKIKPVRSFQISFEDIGCMQKFLKMESIS